MLDSDEVAKAMPVRKDAWKRWFPHLEPLIERIGDEGRYDRFDLIKLKRWSAGQGGGDRRRRACAAAEHRPGRRLRHDECAVACGLSRPRSTMCRRRSTTWERNERPVTEHTQRISYLLGLPTTWPPALRAMALGAGRTLEMAGPAAHQDGAAPADGDDALGERRQRRTRFFTALPICAEPHPRCSRPVRAPRASSAGPEARADGHIHARVRETPRPSAGDCAG